MSLEQLPNADGNNYMRYKGFGGIINQKDYASTLERAKGSKTIDPHSLAQVRGMARQAGITLEDPKTGIDPSIALYAVLRKDVNSEKEKYHHSQMTDQRLFAEALRILGDFELYKKFLNAYPNIFSEEKTLSLPN